MADLDRALLELIAAWKAHVDLLQEKIGRQGLKIEELEARVRLLERKG